MYFFPSYFALINPMMKKQSLFSSMTAMMLKKEKKVSKTITHVSFQLFLIFSHLLLFSLIFPGHDFTIICQQQTLRDQVNMALASKSLSQGLSGMNNPMNPLQPFIFLPLFDGRFGFPPNLNPATLAAAAAAANGFPPGLLVNAAAAGAALSGGSLLNPNVAATASSLSSGSGSSRGTNDSRRSPMSPPVNKSNGHSARQEHKRRNSGSNKSTPLMNHMTKDDFESRTSLQNQSQPLNLKRSSSTSSQNEDSRLNDPFYRALSGMYPGLPANGFPPGFLMNAAASLNHGHLSSHHHSNGPNMSPGSSRGTPSESRRSPFSPQHHHHSKNSSSNGRTTPVSKKTRSNNNNHHDGHLLSNQSEPMNLTRSSPSSSHGEDFRMKNHMKGEGGHHSLSNQSQPQPMNLTSSRSFSNSSPHHGDSRHNSSSNNPYYHPLAGMHMFPDSGLFGKDVGNPFSHVRFPGVTPGSNRTPFPFGLFSPGLEGPLHHQTSSSNSHNNNNSSSNSKKESSGPGSGGSGGFSDSSNVEDKKEDTVVTCQSEFFSSSFIIMLSSPHHGCSHFLLIYMLITFAMWSHDDFGLLRDVA